MKFVRLYITISLLAIVAIDSTPQVPKDTPKVVNRVDVVAQQNEVKDSIRNEVKDIILIDSITKITTKTINLQSELFDKKAKSIENEIKKRSKKITKIQDEKKALETEIKKLKDSINVISAIEVKTDSVCVKWKFLTKHTDKNCVKWIKTN